MSKRVLQTRVYIATIIAMFLGGCQPQDELEITQHELVMQYPTEYTHVPTFKAYEFGVSFENVPSAASSMYFKFDAKCLIIKYGDEDLQPGKSIDVRVDDAKQGIRFTAIGLTEGVHKIEAHSKGTSWTASGSFSITVKNNAYVINLIDEVLPTIRVGEQRALNIEAVDVENPAHKFHNTPGYMVSARSLDYVPTIIDLGAELTWNNFIEPYQSIALPLNWKDNKFSVMYRSYQPGEQYIEFTITSPEGDASRTVHMLHVDSSKVSFTPNRTANDTVNVSEAYEVNYKVDYFGHPHNRLSCMWEPLPFADPYSQSPKLFLDSQMDAKPWVWGEFRRPDIFGFSAYPTPPNKGGISKQGFRLRVRDMFGWDTTIDYRFDVKMSEYGFRLIAPAVTPLLENNLYSCQFELSNYHPGKYRYKFFQTSGMYDDYVTLYDHTYSTYITDVWYNLDLSGSDGKRYLESVQFGGTTIGANSGLAGSKGIEIVIEDEFGIQRSTHSSFQFAPNQAFAQSSMQSLSLVIGRSETFNISLMAAQPDNTMFGNSTLTFTNYEPLYESIEVDGKALPSVAPYTVKSSNKVISVKYTPKSTIHKDLHITTALWTGYRLYNAIIVNAIDDCGAFTATPGKPVYEVPFSSGQITQEIPITLASGKELAGLYDYNQDFEIGTQISCTVIGTSNDIIYALDNNNEPINLSSSPQLLKYAVGKTIRLRHVATASSNGYLNSRVTLNVIRKDGRSIHTTYTLSMTECGAFTATPDKPLYEVPFSSGQITQEIPITLASERESEGLYDYDIVSNSGTKFSCTIAGGNNDQIFIMGKNGVTTLLSSTPQLVKDVIGKTVKLFHRTTVPFGGSLNSRVTLNVIRKDGQSTKTTYTLSMTDCGAFTATPDKSLYELPYAIGEVIQEIPITLASERESAGLYDYDPLSKSGTQFSCTITGGNNDKIYVTSKNGVSALLSSTPVFLADVIDKTVTLRHHTTAPSGGSINSSVTLNVIRKDGQSTKTTYSLSMTDCGAFTATPDRLSYTIPYEDSRVSQDITVALVSEKEPAGLYDYNTTHRTGTQISYTTSGKGRLVAITGDGREIVLSSTPQLLDYAVGKTLKLRHYPTSKVNGGSIDNVRLTVMRRDGVTAQVDYKLTAIDQTFRVERYPPQNQYFVNTGGWVGIVIVNLSKYYKGSYHYHSSEFYIGHPDHPNITPTLTQRLPLPKAPAFNDRVQGNILENSDKPGQIEMRHITIADDNGLTVLYDGNGSPIPIYHYVER